MFFFSVTCHRLGQTEKNEKVYVKFSYVLNPYILISFAVTQLPGKHTAPGMQVLVQGNQVSIVAKFLLGKFLLRGHLILRIGCVWDVF